MLCTSPCQSSLPAVGEGVGSSVVASAAVGSSVGSAVGSAVSAAVGSAVALEEGSRVETAGADDSITVGCCVDGCGVAWGVGACVVGGAVGCGNTTTAAAGGVEVRDNLHVLVDEEQLRKIGHETGRNNDSKERHPAGQTI